MATATTSPCSASTSGRASARTTGRCAWSSSSCKRHGSRPRPCASGSTSAPSMPTKRTWCKRRCARPTAFRWWRCTSSGIGSETSMCPCYTSTTNPTTTRATRLRRDFPTRSSTASCMTASSCRSPSCTGRSTTGWTRSSACLTRPTRRRTTNSLWSLTTPTMRTTPTCNISSTGSSWPP